MEKYIWKISKSLIITIIGLKSLTPLLIQQQFVDKWDGKLPVYGEVPTLFKGLN